MKSFSLLLVPLFSFAMSFNELCDHAYNASGELIGTNGRIVSNTHSKASALAGDPLSLEGDASGVKGKDPKDSGIRYGAMLNFHLKKPAFVDAQSHQYNQISKTLHQEIQLQQGVIQVALKHDWLIATLEQERIGILNEKAASAKEGYAIGQKKVTAGRMSQMEFSRLMSEVYRATSELAMGEMELEHAHHGLQEATMLHEEIVVDDLHFAFISDDNSTDDRINNASILQALSSQIASLDAQMKSARYEGSEAISMGAGATHEPSQNSIDFRITIPLAWSEKNDQKIAALMSEKSALLHRRDVTAQKLRMNIHTLLEHLETREKRFNEALVAQKHQKTLLEMAQKGYEGGVVNQFEYLATKNSFYDARLRTVELKREYIQEMSAMEEKLGRIW
ncbi:MAG: TolC family protein [Sulfuricurvum sp.]|nr:TolC family protein [Sulfuricurvum sp.]